MYTKFKVCSWQEQNWGIKSESWNNDFFVPKVRSYINIFSIIQGLEIISIVREGFNNANILRVFLCVFTGSESPLYSNKILITSDYLFQNNFQMLAVRQKDLLSYFRSDPNYVCCFISKNIKETNIYNKRTWLISKTEKNI